MSTDFLDYLPFVIIVVLFFVLPRLQKWAKEKDEL